MGRARHRLCSFPYELSHVSSDGHSTCNHLYVVFNHTQGSIFIATLLHASIDTPQLVWIPLFLAVGETSINLAGLIAFGVPALLIVILTRGRLGYQPGEDRNGREQEGHKAEALGGKAEQPLLVHTWKEDPSDARHGQTEEHSLP